MIRVIRAKFYFHYFSMIPLHLIHLKLCFCVEHLFIQSHTLDNNLTVHTKNLTANILTREFSKNSFHCNIIILILRSAHMFHVNAVHIKRSRFTYRMCVLYTNSAIRRFSLLYCGRDQICVLYI